METIIAFNFSRAPIMDFMTSLLALLFQPKEPQLSNNRGKAVTS